MSKKNFCIALPRIEQEEVINAGAATGKGLPGFRALALMTAMKRLGDGCGGIALINQRRRGLGSCPLSAAHARDVAQFDGAGFVPVLGGPDDSSAPRGSEAAAIPGL
jgi:hypothetical protein